MYPTLFTIGNLSIPTYTMLLDLGLVLGLVLAFLEGRRQLGSGESALDLGLWAVIGGILGGRIAFVLANWQVFSENWLRAVRIWEGGLSFHGAFLGGLLVMVIFDLLQRRRAEPVPFWKWTDIVTPGLALGIVFGWAACLMGGCSYGTTGQGFGYAILPDIYGVEASRFATQAIGLGFSAVLFLVFWLLRNRWPFNGAAFLMYCLLYLGGQFFLEFSRGDEAIYLGPWRLAQVLDLVMALAAAAGLMALWWQESNREEGEPEATEEPEIDEGAEPPDEGEEAEAEPSEQQGRPHAEGTEQDDVAEAGLGPESSEGEDHGPEAGG